MASPNYVRQLPFRIKKYECVEYLGGNMADVYRAKDLKAERQVVVKLLKPDYCRDPEMRARFTQEAQMACRCSHPNIVATYETDEEHSQPYIIMEHLQGESLRSLVQRGGIETQAEALWLALQVARALEYLHSLDIVHRDIKPENIHVDGSGRAKLLDFGVARFKDSRLTQAGQMIGTPQYMSPEQVRGEPPTVASDIYSFGVLIFEILTLASPYHAQTHDELLTAILKAPPNLQPLADCQVPHSVIDLIVRCLDKTPASRYRSFADVCDLLLQFVSSERAAESVASHVRSTIVQRPPRRIGKTLIAIAATAVTLAILAALFSLLRKPPEPFLTLPSGDMVFVGGGEALLGRNRQPIRVPPFYIDKTEVTNGAFLRFCRDTGYSPPPVAEQAPAGYPVVNISFNDAQAFARWAGKRLPNALEWEKAARGGQGQAYPWGNELRGDVANIPRDAVAAKATTLAPADSFVAGASPYGALNMVGNAWEWVDERAPVPDGEQFQYYLQKLFFGLTPPLSRTEPFYQVRGGSYRYSQYLSDPAALVFDSSPIPARGRKPDIGFRCAKNP